jgi:precorrin-2 dehydrogenase/sirohydrochlorin ferrochelatase
VTVIAPSLTEALGRWVQAGRIKHHARGFAETDLDGVFLALVCERDPALGDAVWAAAGARGVLVYAQDRPDRSHVAMPALVRRGSLRLAISTGEASPALAGRLRAELERIFDEPFVRYLAWLDELRTRLRDEEPDPARRAERLRAAVEGFAVNAVLHYPVPYTNRP